MKIAAITDIHGRIRNLKKAIDLINADSQLDYVINCGDVGGADTLEYLRKIRLPHYLSASQTDLSSPGFITKCKELGLLYSPTGTIRAGNKTIGFSHFYPSKEQLNEYDVFFYGHHHEFQVEKQDEKILVCCGELCGRQIPPCYVIYDSDKNQIKKIDIWNS